MSEKFIVCAVDRKNQGLEYVFRAGRGWPGGVEVEIEVLDQHGDVYAEGGKQLHPTQMGREAWAKLKADKRISWRPFGALTADQALPKVAELESENAKLKVKIADLEMKIADLNRTIEGTLEGAGRGVAAMEKENEGLKAKIAELEHALQGASAMAKENAELKALLDTVTATKPEGDAPKTDDLPKAKNKSTK